MSKLLERLNEQPEPVKPVKRRESSLTRDDVISIFNELFDQRGDEDIHDHVIEDILGCMVDMTETWESLRPAVTRRWKKCAGFSIVIDRMNDLARKSKNLLEKQKR